MEKVYGLNEAEYKNRVLAALNATYDWFKMKYIEKTGKVTIEAIKELVKEHSAEDKDPIRKREPLNTAEDVIAELTRTVEQEITWNPTGFFTQCDEYEVPFFPQELGGGWNLEDYRFTKYTNGAFSSSVTAGDRSAGSGRTFLIPTAIIKGHTYEEFLELYFDEVADPKAFGLGVDALINDHQLRLFLGLSERKPHPEITEKDLPEMTVVYRYEFCRGDCMEHLKENELDGETDLIKNEWKKFKETYRMFDEIALKDEKGEIPAFWGIMTEDNALVTDVTFTKYWTHYYRTGYYLAAFEVNDRSRNFCVNGWERGIIPAHHYVTVDMTGKDYDKTFFEYVDGIIPDLGYRLDGSILERINPKTDKLEVYFPVRKME